MGAINISFHMFKSFSHKVKTLLIKRFPFPFVAKTELRAESTKLHDIVTLITSSSLVSRRMGSKLSIIPLITKGRPRPRLISNTFDPIAFDTAMSPNPSRATIMELKASLKENKEEGS